MEKLRIIQKYLEAAVNELALITGQKPIVTKAKKSISNFKVREGMTIGCKGYIKRRKECTNFLDKLMNIALPRVRDFRGVIHLNLLMVEETML